MYTAPWVWGYAYTFGNIRPSRPWIHPSPPKVSSPPLCYYLCVCLCVCVKDTKHKIYLLADCNCTIQSCLLWIACCIVNLQNWLILQNRDLVPSEHHFLSPPPPYLLLFSPYLPPSLHGSFTLMSRTTCLLHSCLFENKLNVSAAPC